MGGGGNARVGIEIYRSDCLDASPALPSKASKASKASKDSPALVPCNTLKVIMTPAPTKSTSSGQFSGSGGGALGLNWSREASQVK